MKAGVPRWRALAAIGIRLPAVLILVGGMIASFLSWRLIRSQEEAGAAGEFSLASDNYVDAVRREIDANLKAIQVLKAFLETRDQISPAAFQEFATALRQSFPSIMVLEWAPLITDADRPAYEHSLAGSGLEHPYIRNDLRNPPARAPRRSEYMPLSMLSPAEHTEQLVGYDLESTPDVSRAIQMARQSRNLVAGGILRLIERMNDGYGVPVYLAVSDTRNETPRGIALGIFQLASVLENGLRNARRDPVNVAFWDLSARGGKRRIHFHGEDTSLKSEDFDPDAVSPANTLRRVTRFSVGNRQWAMVVRPTPGYLKQHAAYRSRWLLLIEVLGTGFIAACFLLSSVLLRRRAELLHYQSLKDTQEALRRSEERYAIAVRGANDGLWDWDLSSGILYVSARWKEILGLSEDFEISMPCWSGFIHPADRQRAGGDLSRHLSGKSELFESEYRIMHADGAYRWVRARGFAVRGADGNPTRVAGSLTDVTATKVLDPLTGLPNRLCFGDKLEFVVDRFRRDRTRQFAVIFIDLDRFKVINDSLGHVVGDELLQAIGRRISRISDPVIALAGFGRSSAARLGGDEFAILLEDVVDRAKGVEFAERISTVFNEPFLVAGRELYCAASIGIAFSDDEHSDPADILRDADTAMYHAKNRGRSRLEVFDSLMRACAQSRMDLEMAMREGLEREEFAVLFQPRVLLKSGVITGFEALVRWHHPSRGLIAPMEFVSIAEETGMIVPIGKVVLRESCRALRRWKDLFPSFSSLKMSVNVSAKQLNDADLFSYIVSVLQETGVAPGDLCLEITESVLMEQTDGLQRLLEDIRSLGVGLEIDDFGTGFCSLTYLHQFTFDAIKVDRTFVSGLSEGKTEIVRTVVTLGQNLGIPVIAEGIETQDQRFVLQSMGCLFGQGYLFAAPLNAAAIDEILAKRIVLGSPVAFGGIESGLDESDGVRVAVEA